VVAWHEVSSKDGNTLVSTAAWGYLLAKEEAGILKTGIECRAAIDVSKDKQAHVKF
jgi:hypothetical protein